MENVSRTAKFAARTSRMRASTIREMLKVTQQPDVISFGGGLPAPELFPTQAIADCTRQVMDEYGALALQYSVTDGIPELRSWVAKRLANRLNAAFQADNVLIVNGSQQGLDLVGKIFLDPGDHVALENPSYVGAIQAFDAYQARYATVATDEDGMVRESLEMILARTEPAPKFVYLVPNFQNPTGRTLATHRRETIVRLCEHYGVPIVEDDPYGDLRFEGEDLPSLVSIPTSGTIIYSGTGSKIMAPGMRVAWLVMHDEDVREKLILAKQGADLQSGTFTQYVFERFVSDDDVFRKHIARIVDVYRSRRDVMHAALTEFMPRSVEFNRPDGGMFLWARAPGLDTSDLLQIAARDRVVFVPGVSFYPHGDVTDGMRLNFSNAGEDNIRRGIERLGTAVRSFNRLL
ncbi:MAG: PLP-dependent aminotransferase family protein [Candidatus Eremiobacteraeota bacterium]|nr:PLP-dependent aminotransferase family protein [Candidatus Eremiobacteraeota bacterium]